MLTETSFAGPRSFARAMLASGQFISGRLGTTHVHGGYALETILFRDGCWQVELISMWPGAKVPLHRHNRCDSCDLMLGGGTSKAVIRGRVVPPVRVHGDAESHLVRVGRGVWHCGEPGTDGAVYLSFQKWEGEPSFISDDWEER